MKKMLYRLLSQLGVVAADFAKIEIAKTAERLREPKEEKTPSEESKNEAK